MCTHRGPRCWRRLQTAFVLALSLICAPALAHQVFFVDQPDGLIYRCGYTGGSLTVMYGDVFGETSDPYGVALDTATDTLYWSDDGRILGAASSGSGSVGTLVSSAGIAVRHVAVDTATGNVYWTDKDGSAIMVYDAATGQTTQLYGGTAPLGIALDQTNDMLYWTDGGDIKRATSDILGGSVTTVYSNSSYEVREVDVDPANGKMYWTENQLPIYGDTNRIRRANLSGSSVETLYTTTATLNGIAIDGVAGTVFWATSGSIRKADAAGGGTVTTIVSGLTGPRGLLINRTS